MRILHVDSARSWRGGQNQVLLTALATRARGHEVTLVCRRGSALAERALAAGLDVVGLPFSGDLSLVAALALTEVTGTWRPDVAHLHDPHAISAGALAGLPIPAIATRRVDFPLQGILSRWKYRRCDRVVAVSQAIQAALAQGGVDEGRIRVVYEGVPDRAPRPGGREALAAAGLPPGAPVVLNVAALTGHKDHETLLAAAALVLAQRDDVRFVIAGDGELRRALPLRARALGVADRVTFLGFRDDVDALLPACDLFCLSSHHEGLGTSLLDAMCFARPVVATAAGGIPEAVEADRTGLLVPPRDARALADALLAVLGDPVRARALGEAGRARFAAHFTVERMVERTLEVYAEVALRHNPAPT